jgi:phosphoglycerate dehydrogenase-like enzyme
VRIVVRAELRADLLDRLRAESPAVEFVLCAKDHGLFEALAEADALISGPPVTAEMLAAAPRVRWVQCTFTGVDAWPLAAFAARGIPLTNMRGAPGPNIAEHIIALMFAFARAMPELFRRQQAASWPPISRAPPTFDLAGQRVCLLGYGEIGRNIAWRAKGLGMEVWALRRNPGASAEAHVDRMLGADDLDALLAGADHLANSLPLTPATANIIDARALGLMKPAAYIYNVGRGATIDQEALTQALRDGRIAGAGLDVTEPEPLPADSPLWTMPNVIITGHTSGPTRNYWERAIEVVSGNIQRFTKGLPLTNLVDPEAGY